MSAERAAVELAGVGHRYGDRVALTEISLSLPLGSDSALIGPDGMGKSTLLGLIAGVRRLQAGRLLTLGGDIASAGHRERIAARIAYMPQGLGRNLYPSLSVAENADFFGRLFGLTRRERANRIARLLSATGLARFAGRDAGKLSGGMRQKLSLCCALIHDPDLLILDEPTTGIDSLSRRQFWQLIADIKGERPEMTLLISTSYMEEAERFGRILALARGRLLAAGSRTEILARTGAATLEQAYRALQADGEARPHVAKPRPFVAAGRPAVLAQDLTRRFGDFTAVDRVSFGIARGEIFGFIGSNGCGKTTTMKMLTGLLPVSEGRAELLGRPVEAADPAIRMRVGYMSQTFSLYEELSVRANLALHARLYRLPARDIPARIADTLARFDLEPVAQDKPRALPLGIRQRLQLAVACLHRPEMLILDEPTSGVDLAARDRFWEILLDLSRNGGVTILISTHFMNEAERCDRIALMHAGRVLVTGTPAEIRSASSAESLDAAFIAQLETADPAAFAEPSGPPLAARDGASAQARPAWLLSVARLWAFARRELQELLRDHIRLAFAILGPLILMVNFGYGITFDVENLPFAVFDRDQSAESRELVDGFSGSRYFQQMRPIAGDAEIDRRMQAGDLRLAISIPPGFGEDLLHGRPVEIGLSLDGSNPFRAETTRNYAAGILAGYLADRNRRSTPSAASAPAFRLEPRFRYNQDFRSAVAITPGIVMILLIFIPATVSALGIVREREIGSISNLYASPASIGEFLLGKQLPYILLGGASLLSLVAVVRLLFGVAITGSSAALLLGGLLYLFAGTALGLLVSSFVRSQVTAIIATAIITTLPAVNFSGFLYPVATLAPSGRLIGMSFPSLWFQNISLGTFAKARDFFAFYPEYLALFGFGVAYLVAARLILRKQER